MKEFPNLPVFRFGPNNILAQSEVVSRAFGRYLGYSLMVLALLVTLVLGLATIAALYTLGSSRVLAENVPQRTQQQAPAPVAAPQIPKAEIPAAPSGSSSVQPTKQVTSHLATHRPKAKRGYTQFRKARNQCPQATTGAHASLTKSLTLLGKVCR